MRVLYVTGAFPYPLTSGFLRHYHLIRELSVEHRITLLALAGRGFVAEHAEALHPFTERTIAIPTGQGGRGSRSGWQRRVRAVGRRVRGEPGVAELRATAARLHADEPYDAMVLAGKSAAPVISAVPDLPVVVDLCDATTLRLRGQLAHAGPLRRLVLAADIRRIGRMESQLAARADRILTASARDRLALFGAAGADDPRVTILPNGVDAEHWRRTPGTLGRDRIVLTGAMHYPPNEDAAVHLVEAVLPRVRRRVPEATVAIVGRDPTARVRALASIPGVIVTGFVDDVRPFLDEAAVFAAPIRFGSGIQNKILEAMAMEVPVVASSVAADGLRLEGVEAPPIAVADEPGAFAERVVERLEAARVDPVPDRAARAFVTGHFTWDQGGRRLAAALAAAADGRRAAAVPVPQPARGER
jgi:glycosyltransferase involved in cell wall biosynthesis